MSSFYLNTFRPLAINPAGRDAVEKHGLPPFIDGSIRREPDFEHPRPVITCLCRGGQFAPRLRAGDRVAYMTVKRRYERSVPHWRFVAILKVDQIFDTHRHAAEWYDAEGLPLPNNLMVPGNEANPLSHSHRENDECRPRSGCARGCGSWDAGYERRAKKFPCVVGCSPLYIETGWAARVIEEDDLIAVFGEVPGTRNPGRLDLGLLTRLQDRLDIDLDG